MEDLQRDCCYMKHTSIVNALSFEEGVKRLAMYFLSSFLFLCFALSQFSRTSDSDASKKRQETPIDRFQTIIKIDVNVSKRL